MKQIIKDIIIDFAKQELVFSNEQDFQIEMALALKTGKYGVKDVKLEIISLNETWEDVKKKVQNKEKIDRQIKQYHDILVKFSDDEYVLIELKYKTPSKLCFYKTKRGEMITFAQGVYDIGAYDFLKDISRLETISERHMPGEIQKKIKKSYAVLLTNDKNYRYNRFDRKKKNGTQSPWINYSIHDNKEFEKGRLYFLINKKNESAYKTPNGRHFDSIDLNNDYKFEWCNYELAGYNNYEDKKVKRKSCTCPGFSYLIVEVKPLSNKIISK